MNAMMTIEFRVEYVAREGETLVVNIAASEGTVVKKMKSGDGRTWSCRVKLDATGRTKVDYYYSVMKGREVARREWAFGHLLLLTASKARTIVACDKWVDRMEDSELYSSAVVDCLRRRRKEDVRLTSYDRTVRLKVRAPQLRGEERLFVVGSVAALGQWKASEGLRMTEQRANEWAVDIDATEIEDTTVEMKFVAVSTSDGAVVWEDGMNRRLEVGRMTKGGVVAMDYGDARFAIGDVRCAGTMVPLFALRTETSYGVGDIGDLRKMIDWVATTGQRVLQLLPINDTTTDGGWGDSYPYNVVSVQALHPQYVDLSALPKVADAWKRRAYEARRRALNALEEVDYVEVNALKCEVLRELFAQEGAKMLRTKVFGEFFKANEDWLAPYAQYSLLRDRFGTADFTHWKGKEHFDESDRVCLRIGGEYYEAASYYYFVQYVLWRQMTEAKEYARARGVILKGDIPIGVSRRGCDAWHTPQYFNMDGQAGAPPDDFSLDGQNWGFPTYNWAAMMADGGRWWKRRAEVMAQYFDAYRIDHVLGFFRIWDIPLSAVHGLLGQFVPSLGLTREEMAEWGFTFDEGQHVEPFITDESTASLFGDSAAEVRTAFMERTGDGRWKLKKAVDTQRKVEAVFAGRTSDEDMRTRDGLYAALSDVLFVKDYGDGRLYHPRICAYRSWPYKALDDGQRQAFDALYEDYFYKRNNRMWYEGAMKKLPLMVDATGMMACAEDLGMVQECVAWGMNDLRILSLEVQTMPKEPFVRFGTLERYPYRSVCTISTHDTATLRMWWDEDGERTQDYYNKMLGKFGEAPHPLPGWLARDIVARHVGCPSMLCIVALQDWMAIDEGLRRADAEKERVNVPSDAHHCWRYRMHITIEALIAAEDFNRNIRSIIKEGGRD